MLRGHDSVVLLAKDCGGRMEGRRRMGRES
jgi:hypothetical protein